MEKKRKSEDIDENKILRKIRKLEKKLKNKRTLEDTEDTSPRRPLPDDRAPIEDSDSIYLPPSEWAGTLSATVELSPRSISPDLILEEHSLTVDQSPQPGPSSAPVSSPPKVDDDEDIRLDENILNILGEAPKTDIVFGKNVHKDIAARWQEILLKGLLKETKQTLVNEYLIPANCDMLAPPILNPEAKAALPETLVKRDFALLSKQKHLAAALAGLAQVINMLISNEVSKEKLLKPISDASRLLCDMHNLETKTRRSFVLASINSSLKGALLDTHRDKYLFGENLTEKLNAAKSIQKSGDTLKNHNRMLNKIGTNNNNKTRFPSKVNPKALHPRSTGRSDAGQLRLRPAVSRAPANRMQPQRPRSPPPPPPPPRAHYNRR